MNILKRIRQFFWMSTGLGMLSVFTNFTPASLSKGDATNKVAMVGNALEGASEVLVADDEPGGRLSDEPVYSSTGKSMLWKGKRYVLIRNKWVIERADSVYIVDGQRTYFKDKGKIDRNKKQVGGESEGSTVAAVRYGTTKKATDLLNKVMSNPLKAYSPETMKQMAEALSAAKETISDHNKQLEELSK